jgi:hypothetical protein
LAALSANLSSIAEALEVLAVETSATTTAGFAVVIAVIDFVTAVGAGTGAEEDDETVVDALTAGADVGTGVGAGTGRDIDAAETACNVVGMLEGVSELGPDMKLNSSSSRAVYILRIRHIFFKKCKCNII